MKNSDKMICLTPFFRNNLKRFGLTVLNVLVVIGLANAQDFSFIEGEVHSFRVENHDGNTFVWSFNDQSFNPMPAGSIDYLSGQNSTDVTVRFVDLDRTSSELAYLMVTESNQNGCSTQRAISIELMPNNMYLEFASAETQECFSMGDYYAPLKVGLNFLDKAAGVEIPASRFPLKVSYEIKNVTDGLATIAGNSGEPLTIEYSATGDYFLLVTEAVGEANRTMEYELAITTVIDKYQTVINNNAGDVRLQIRIINHLPQSGGMDMAMAYVLTPVNYLGAY